MYVNYYGCHEYPMGLYTNNPANDQGRLGGIMYCDKPTPQPWLTSVYCISFIFITAFCMLALFVGSVTLSMSEGIERFEEKKAQERKNVKVDTATEYNPRLDPSRPSTYATRRARCRLKLGFQGIPVDAEENPPLFPKDGVSRTPLEWFKHLYHVLADRSTNLAHHHHFRNFITLCVFISVLEAGMVADNDLHGHAFVVFDGIVYGIQCIFAVECFIKLVAEELTPWMYFTNGWNVFDLCITVGAFLDGSSNLVLMLRILRVFRVIRLMRSLPQLQVIVTALMDSVSSIGYASILLCLFFYFFGVLGNILFAENDPWRFGTLHMTMATLFQVITLDNWNDILYTNMFGCDLYGYEDYFPAYCTSPKPQLAISCIYFSILIVLGSFVLLSLFIGVVSNCLEQATKRQKAESQVDIKVKAIAKKFHLTELEIKLYRDSFYLLDSDSQRYLEINEFLAGFRVCNVEISNEEVQRFWNKVSDGVRGCIDFSEYLLAMMWLRKDKCHLFENNEPLVLENTEEEESGIDRFWRLVLFKKRVRGSAAHTGPETGKGEGEGEELAEGDSRHLEHKSGGDESELMRGRAGRGGRRWESPVKQTY
eukprot:CAMPEP_0182432850 /NCGR_PEP_ID=MMETSP1167-20130531/59313_1 /TAXON_ID=2988 /ORGANISM="Mallomonas Sp, Strain CCMP3275" /LENGTH=594 /DNA_ID=CAMNT_0024620853 /DNA_START=264 /DNA_END=2048 /DNA_ORIENTATION=-